jgi:hypothetical protein
MPFVAIHGTFHIQSHAPNVRSLHFYADQSEVWSTLNGEAAILNEQQQCRLKLQGLEGLESDYLGFQQPQAMLLESMKTFWSLLEIRSVVLQHDGRLIQEADDGSRGFVLARRVESDGCPVAFAFMGGSSFNDGQTVYLDGNLLRRSVNYQLLESGWAFPDFTPSLFSDLREELTRITRKARQEDLGLWPFDVTQQGIALEQLSSLTERHIVLPRLFRKLIEHWKQHKHLDGLEESPCFAEQSVLLLEHAHFAHFNDLLQHRAGILRLTEAPENLVFLV